MAVVHAANDSMAAVDLAAWQQLAEAVLSEEGVADTATLDLTFVDEAAIAALNAEWMDKVGPTDVLSFPIEDDPHVEHALLGDVVICPSVVAAQATEGTEAEMALMVVHGILHILGMDHAEPDEAKEMRAAELRHLKAWFGAVDSGQRS